MQLKTKKPVDITLPVDGDDALEAQTFVGPAPAGHNYLKEAALKAYNRQTHQQRQDKMIVEYIPMVHKIVSQVVTYLHPPLSREDLVSAGTIGLVKAARDFDPSHDAEFKTYAYIRVKGAVIDELREWSFTPTGLKKQFENARQTLQEMTVQLGQMPTDLQLAKKLGTSVTKMYKMFENARARHFLSLHGISDEAPALGNSLAAKNVAGPEQRIQLQELQKDLTEAISQLPEKQRQIVILYYHKDLTMKEIAKVLKVTESRVSQLHAAALFKMSIKLKQWDDKV